MNAIANLDQLSAEQLREQIRPIAIGRNNWLLPAACVLANGLLR